MITRFPVQVPVGTSPSRTPATQADAPPRRDAGLALRSAAPRGRPLRAADVLHLQRTAGNSAVGRLLARPAPTAAPPGGSPRVQRMTIGGLDIPDLAGLAEQADHAGWGFADALETEIANRLIRTDYDYDSIDQFENEVRMRMELIRGLELIEQDGVNIHYNHGGDNLKLPADQWNTIVAYDEEEEPAANPAEPGGAAFRSRNTPAAAVDAIFADKDEQYFLECNTATVAIHYRALKEVLGTAAFDAMFPHGLTLMPEWLTTAPAGGDAPSLALIPETDQAVGSLNDLVPGDWVYFVNFPDYPDKHPDGAFTGENALYVGGGMFRGFGVAAKSHDDMNAFLMQQYNRDLPAPQKKHERADSEETLDGKVPGITRAGIRRAAENQAIRNALEPG